MLDTDVKNANRLLMDKTSILVVEDEIIVAKNIENKLTGLGFNVVATTSTGEDAIEKAKSLNPDLVLMDIKLKGEIDGIEAARVIREEKHLPIIYLTSYPDDETFRRAIETEPFGYLIKPFDAKELQRTIEIALYKNELNIKLLETKKMLERAVYAGKTSVWELWFDEKKLVMEPFSTTISGFPINELRDNFELWKKVVHPNDLEFVTGEILRLWNNEKERTDFEFRIITKSGKHRWINLQATVHPPEGNKPRRIIGSATDITERKLSEIALKESEEKFRTIFENSSVGMSLLSPDLNFITVNKSFASSFGYTPEEFGKLNMLEITHPSDINRSLEIAKEFMRSSSLYSKQVEKRYIRKNGEMFWGMVNLTPIREPTGKIKYFVVQLYDITKRKSAETQLAKNTRELEELNKAKDKFFSIISHDLRSPFNALQGIAEYTIQYIDDMSKDEIKESISNIYNSTRKVYNFLNNLLEWTQIQTGRLELEKSKLNLNDLIAGVCSLYEESGINKKITIEQDVPKAAYIFADHYMIETVLRNLISNGIKFTHPGGKVSITAEVKGNLAEITVADTGIGISNENQQKLFRIDDQYRVEGTANEKGTGLGLILCKELVEKNGGTIRLESKKDEGSKFIFTVPLYLNNK